MRTFAAVAAAALTLGCTASSTAVEGNPPLRHVAIARLAEEPAHDDELPVQQPPGPVDRSDPAAVAAALIVAGLAEQGLQVVDLGVQTLAVNPTAATVRVAATHRAEMAGAPHTSVYELDLTPEPDGSWRVVDFRQAH